MRIKTNVCDATTFTDTASEFISFKMAEQVSARTIKDYRVTFDKFANFGRNTMNEKMLCEDIVAFFKGIPDTSPAVYNRPLSCLSAFFNWCVKQKILSYNPISKVGLHKKKDDGNIHAAEIADIKALLNTCDKSTFTGLRNYTMIASFHSPQHFCV